MRPPRRADRSCFADRRASIPDIHVSFILNGTVPSCGLTNAQSLRAIALRPIPARPLPTSGVGSSWLSLATQGGVAFGPGRRITFDFTHYVSATFNLLPVHGRTSKNLPEGAWLGQRLC